VVRPTTARKPSSLTTGGSSAKDYPALNEFEAVCRERGYSSLKKNAKIATYVKAI
jgi:hypothetical protein